MATTYLILSNRVLRELNEVEMTSSNFSSSRGIQTAVKMSNPAYKTNVFAGQLKTSNMSPVALVVELKSTT